MKNKLFFLLVFMALSVSAENIPVDKARRIARVLKKYLPK